MILARLLRGSRAWGMQHAKSDWDWVEINVTNPVLLYATNAQMPKAKSKKKGLYDRVSCELGWLLWQLGKGNINSHTWVRGKVVQCVEGFEKILEDMRFHSMLYCNSNGLKKSAIGIYNSPNFNGNMKMALRLAYLALYLMKKEDIDLEFIGRLVARRSAIFMFPVLHTVLTSLKKPVDAFSMPPKWLFIPSLKYHIYIWTKEPFPKGVGSR